MAGGEASEDEDEEEAAPAVGSPKPKEIGVDPEQAKPDMRAEAIVPELAETAVSAEDIAGD